MHIQYPNIGTFYANIGSKKIGYKPNISLYNTDISLESWAY